jgi:hypothetical protein
MDPASFIQGSAFLHEEEKYLYVCIKVQIKKTSRRRCPKGELREALENITSIFRLCCFTVSYRRSRSKRAGYVTLYRRYVLPNLGNCSIQRSFTAARNEDMIYPFLKNALRGS